MKDHNLRAFVDQVKERTDIVQLLSEYITLNRNFMAICPFHSDTKPSLRIYPHTQSFNCFGCKAHGDVIDFITLHHKIPFWDALTLLAQRAGLPMPNLKDEDLKQIQHERRIEDILFDTAHYYHLSLNPEAKAYLTNQRMITDETIKSFLIGYANGGLKKYLTNDRKYSLEDCLQAGVLFNDEGKATHDFFYHRITLPSFKYGRVINISGRIFPEGDPKYLHLRGRPISLYNQDALCSKQVLIVEGIFDCLSAIQHGYSAVALQGAKNFREEYLPLFQKVEMAYICLDGDKAGREGMRYIGSLLEDKARIVLLPDEKDPDEYLKENGPDKFQELLNFSLDPIENEISIIPQDTKKIDLPRKLTPILKRISKRPRIQQEPFLKESIQKRFSLNNNEISEYRRLIHSEERSHKEEKKESKPTGKPLAIFPGLVDLVEYQGQPAYLIKEGDHFLIKKETNIDGQTYHPPPKDQLLFLLPEGERVMALIHDSRETDQRLYNDTVELFKRNFELPSEEYYHLFALWDLHTYLLENFNYSPQICLYSLESRGKSRTGMTLIYTAYRGIFTEEVREPVIIRMAQLLNASFFFDVWKIWETAQDTRSVDLLLQRFQRGSQVARVTTPERESFEDYRIFSVFGPTIYATNEPSHRVLESRGIVINMPKSQRTFEVDVTREYLLSHKERMVAFRARHLGEVLPYCDKPSSERLGDIMKPLYQVLKVVCPEREQNFLDLIRELEEERKMVKSQTKEAEIIEALINLEPNVTAGTLPINDITEKVNEGRREKFQYSSKTIGRTLRTMGFKGRRLSGGSRAIIYDKDKVSELALEHGLETSLTALTAQKTLFEG